MALAEVSFDFAQGLPDPITMMHSAQRVAAIPEASEREEAVQTLFKLLDGVLANPEDPKKRKIRKSNEVFKRKAGRHPGAIEFLNCCGFLDSDDPEAPEGEQLGGLLFMPVAYVARLTDAHHTLARCAEEVGLTAPPLPASKGFNPFQSSVRTTDSSAKNPKAPDQWKSEADRLRDEVKKRQRELEEKVHATPAVDLRPSAFWLSAGRRLEDVVRETAAVDEEKGADSALVSLQVAAAKATISGANSKFESADKKRLSELSGKKVYETCILRVICPDKAVLQVHFRAGDKGEQVKASLEPLLSAQVRESGWYLYQSPPLRRLAPKETLAQAGLTPGANMYLGFEGAKPGPPYLAESFASQLGPPLQETGRAVSGAQFSGEAMGWGPGQRVGGQAASSRS